MGVECKNYIGVCGIDELKVSFLRAEDYEMRKLLLLLMICLITACTVEVGKVSKERKELYDHNNDKEFCEQHPDKCVNGIPWM